MTFSKIGSSLKIAHVAALALLWSASVSTAGAEASKPAFGKVMIVVLENADYADAINRPYFRDLAHRGALLTNYHAIGHPSQPNYVALIAGDPLGVSNDKPVNLKERHLGDLLEEAGKSWGVYAEDYPGDCFLGQASGDYVRKHVPFLSFRNVQRDSARCARIKAATELDEDIVRNVLPDFSLYVPNLKNDGHDTGVEQAEAWLKKAFGPRLADPRFMRSLLLVVTFDEGADRRGDNRVMTLLLGDMVEPGSLSDARLDHYSLLRTVEWGLGLGDLKRSDSRAAPIGGIWR